MTSEQTRLFREYAKQCRALARAADELRRKLTDLAEEADDRAIAAEGSTFVPRLRDLTPVAASPRETFERLATSIKDAARLLGIGRSTIYRLIGEGHLHTVKIGNRTLIKTASIRALAQAQIC